MDGDEPGSSALETNMVVEKRSQTTVLEVERGEQEREGPLIAVLKIKTDDVSPRDTGADRCTAVA